MSTTQSLPARACLCAASRAPCALRPGRLTDIILAVKYAGGARHDLGFYEFLLCFLWIPLLHYLGRKNKVDDPPRGTIPPAMLAAYCVPRFFLDFLRATDVAYHDVRHLGLTPAQYACVGGVLLAVRFFARLRSTTPRA